MQVMHDNNITILCTALYHSSGFFIIMSPAEGLHFSALVYYSIISVTLLVIPRAYEEKRACNYNLSNYK